MYMFGQSNICVSNEDKTNTNQKSLDGRREELIRIIVFYTIFKGHGKKALNQLFMRCKYWLQCHFKQG